MMSWWKRSLAWQFIGFMLAALLVGQAVSYALSAKQREFLIRQTVESDFISRSAALANSLGTFPAEMYGYVVRASSNAYARFWISRADPLADRGAWYRSATEQLSLPLSHTFVPDHVKWRPDSAEDAGKSLSEWQPLISDLWPDSRNAQFLHFSGQEGMGIVVALDNGTWLNAVSFKASPPNIWSTQTLLSVGITALALCLISILVANRIARPLRQLALSAEALGRGEDLPPFAAKGPDDIRQLYEAFDRMQIRLRRFVDDRTRMLAAIGHDMRTPLTTLRLRAEFVTDTQIQQKILATVDEMETMTEAALSFARSEATAEDTRAVDLSALLGSLCDDMAELGHDVNFAESDRINYRCRPDNLKRAVRNLIENALRYAGTASVSLQTSSSSIDIVVEDQGPGIPEAELEQVFAPFYRLEQSRNRQTGGVGLGLSIARAIARHHGGDILLASNSPGLRATVTLPTA